MAGVKKHWTVVGGKKPIEDEIWVYGDQVYEITYSLEGRKTVDEFFEANSGLKDLFRHYFKRQSNPIKADIELKVTKNKELAKIVRAHIKSTIESHTGVEI